MATVNILMALELCHQSWVGLIFTTVAVTVAALALSYHLSPKLQLPIINGKKALELTNAKARKRYTAGAKELLSFGFSKSKAFYLNTDNGLRLVLSGEYAKEVQGNPHLDLQKAIGAEMHCYIPGMEGYEHTYFPESFGVKTMRLSINRALKSIHKIDVSSVLESHWTSNTEWHRFALNPKVLSMVSEMTAEVRSGKSLAQRHEWHRLSVDFTTHTFKAAAILNKWPRLLRQYVHWFLPCFKQVRKDIEEARQLYDKEMSPRKAKEDAAVMQGEAPPIYEDMIYWLDEHSKGAPFDAVMAQLMMAQAMIHGTADLITQSVFNIVTRPELLEELRAEMISVLGSNGVTTDSLSQLHFLDSAVKETLRVKPLFLVTMKRYAEKRIVLSDGVVIPKDTQVVLDMGNMWNESIYPHAGEFQADRFLKMRHDPQTELDAQLSSSSANHLGFGYGRHVCPGRFYASALIKMTLCHIILKYDLKLVGGVPEVGVYGISLTANAGAEIEVRRRQEEISI